MLKNIIRITIVLAVFITILFVSRNHIENTRFDELNGNIDISGFQLLEEYSDSLKDNLDYYETGGFGGHFYSHIDDEFHITYSGYPDVLDEHKLTRIEVEAGNSSVFGIRIGSTIDEVKSIMESHGYETDIHGPYWPNLLYENGKISILFTVNDNECVESILIEVFTTNKDNVVY